ncbi:MAG: sensor histidine kinase KdpD [Chloroflexi bacterium]|nr:sensor histidine kinase KdpD [Chloroflexota bacterium]
MAGIKPLQKQWARDKSRIYFPKFLQVINNFFRYTPWRNYALSLGLVVFVTLVGLPFDHSFDHANIVMLYLLAEVIAATRFGLGPSIVAALASVIAYHYFFILPRFTFDVEEAQYLLTFTGLLIVGLVISTLTARVREQVNAAERREAQTADLYDFSRSLAAAIGMEAIIQTVITRVKLVFNREVVILLPEPKSNMLSSYAHHPDFTLDDREQAVATWVFQNGESAGQGTETLPAASLRYHPLQTAGRIVGVLGIKPTDTGGHLAIEQQRLLETFASQAAVAIERVQLDEQAQQTQLLREKEKLQTALLNSISHDLRTPLASITGVLSSLRDDTEAYLDPATQRELVENAYEEADRMNRLVANLLDMTRLQAGGMKVVREPCDVQDVVGVALAELSNKLQDRSVTITVPSDLPLVPVDFILISRVLINLLDNAHKYSPPGTPIEIQARMIDNRVEIEVADRGLGIPEDEISQVFEKFYRVKRTDNASGTGLGLSICQGIIETHGGQIWANNRRGGGTIITLALPVEQPETTITEVSV